MSYKNTIKEGWGEMTLGEVAEINPTESLKKGASAKYVAMENLMPFTRKIAKFEVKEFNGGMKFRNGDTLFARITPCLENGKTSFVDILDNDEVGFGSTEYIVIRKKEDLSDPKFLYYLATSPRFRQLAIKAMNGTSGRQRVQTDLLVNEKLILPPLSEQHEIAAVLSSLDDKIELLEKQNETLEKIAQAIFKRWFVEFEFPVSFDNISPPAGGGVRGGGSVGYKSSGGKMVKSELGDLPEGWRVGNYGDLMEVTTGKGLNKEQIGQKGKFSVLGANGEIGKTDDFLFDENLILTGRVGTLGKVYISLGKVWISDNVLISRPREPKNFYFGYFILKNFNFESLNRGSTQPLVTQTDLKNMPIIIPEKNITNCWHNIASSLFDKINLNNQQIQSLSHLRDTLLPKLMKGEVKIIS